MKPYSSCLAILVFASIGWASFGEGGDLVPFDSDEGARRFAQSKFRSDFQKLAVHFQSQRDGVSCGPTTMTVVLNALRWNTPKAPLPPVEASLLKQAPMDPATKQPREIRIRGYSINDMFDSVDARHKKGLKSRAELWGKTSVRNLKTQKEDKDFGLQLEQLAQLLAKGHGLQVTKHAVGTAETETTGISKETEETFRRDLRTNLATEGDYMIVNYTRAKIPSQSGGGHIAPLGAYDEKSDSVLILDVNPTKGAWAWVSVDDLLAAMNTFDTIENRGYLLVKD